MRQECVARDATFPRDVGDSILGVITAFIFYKDGLFAFLRVSKSLGSQDVKFSIIIVTSKVIEVLVDFGEKFLRGF